MAMTISLLYFAFIGGLIYRIRGGLAPSLPRPLDQLLFCYPLFLAAVIAGGGWLAYAAYALAVAGCATGHGQYMGLGRWRVPVKEMEALDFIPRLIFGRDEVGPAQYPVRAPAARARDLFGLAVTGLAMTLAPGLLIMSTGNFWPGFLLGASGILKAAAYWIGWLINDRFPRAWPGLKSGAEAGEWLTGAFLYAVAVPVICALATR